MYPLQAVGLATTCRAQRVAKLAIEITPIEVGNRLPSTT